MGLRRLWPLLAGMLVAFAWGDALAQTPSGAVTLQWTAPGDDSLTGTAARYDLRYSLFPINGLSFAFASGVMGLPLPAAPGTVQRFTVYGLLPGLRYYFALKTADEHLNWSPISNVVAFAEKSAGVNPDEPEVTFAAPIPNPAGSRAGFAYSLPHPMNVSIRVYDVQGRMIRGLVDGPQPAGADLAIWDLHDQVGLRVSPGVYLARAVIGETTIVRRVLVAR